VAGKSRGSGKNLEIPDNFAIGVLFRLDDEYYANILNVEKNILLLISKFDKVFYARSKRVSKAKLEKQKQKIRNFTAMLKRIPLSAGLASSVGTACEKIHSNVVGRYDSFSPQTPRVETDEPAKRGYGKISEVLKDAGLMVQVKRIGGGKNFVGYWGGVGNLDVLEKNTGMIWRKPSGGEGQPRWWKFESRYPGWGSGFPGRGKLTGWWEFQEDLNSKINRQFFIDHSTKSVYKTDENDARVIVGGFILGKIHEAINRATSGLK